MEFPGLLKKLQGEFPGVNYKQSTISRGDQENGISRSCTSMREYGTKTTPVFLPADGEASWSLLPSSVSLLSGGTVQPKNTYSRILNVTDQV